MTAIKDLMDWIDKYRGQLDSLDCPHDLLDETKSKLQQLAKKDLEMIKHISDTFIPQQSDYTIRLKFEGDLEDVVADNSFSPKEKSEVIKDG